MPRILVTHNDDLLRNFYSLEAVEELRKIGEVVLNTTGEPLNGERLVAAARDCDIIVSDRLMAGTPEVLDRLPRLLAVLRCAVDARNLDVEAASRNGIPLVRCSQGYADAVAELAIGLMIALGRRIPAADQMYKQGQHCQPMLMTRQLAGASLGVIGYGAIGSRICELGIAMRMQVSAFDPYKRIVHGSVRQVDFETVLSRPDYVVCAAYATPETRDMMNAAAFARMRRDAYFVNISRGALVDEAALEAALQAGTIAGAGLDVGKATDEQPRPSIAALPNVVAVPHVAGLTREASDHQAFETVQQVREVLAGKAPVLAINPEQWTRGVRLRNDLAPGARSRP